MKIPKYQNTPGPLKLSYDELKYLEWSLLPPKQKRHIRNTKAKAILQQAPSIPNLWEAFLTYIGNRDPKNPNLITGEPAILPGRGPSPKLVLNVAKGVRTLEDYLKTTKVFAPKLEGTGHLRANYADDRFMGGVIFLNSLPDEAMKIQGHGMDKSATIQDALARLRYILDNGIKGKFYTAPLKISKDAQEIGTAFGTGGGTPYFGGHFLITGKPGQYIDKIDDISTVYINDAYENEEALKAALKLLQYLLLTYPKINFKLYSLGFKQGGKMNTLQFLKNGGIHIKKENRGKFTKSAKAAGESVLEHAKKVLNDPNATPLQKKRANFARNAAKWHHKDGGIIKSLKGTKINWGEFGTNLLSSYLKTKSSNKKTDNDYLTLIASLELERTLKNKMIPYLALKIAEQIQMNDPENSNAYAGVPAQILPYRIMDYLQGQNDKEYNDKIKVLEMRSLQLKNQNNTDFWTGLAELGVGILGKYLGNKNSTTSSNTTSFIGTTPLTNSSININNQYSLMSLNPQYWTSK